MYLLKTKNFIKKNNNDIAEEHLQIAAEIGRTNNISLSKLQELLTLFTWRMNNMEYALKLSNVCKEYDSSEFALDNVTFDLPTGTVMGFVGENGAGKTTTIGCILNTLKKDKGR